MSHFRWAIQPVLCLIDASAAGCLVVLTASLVIAQDSGPSTEPVVTVDRLTAEQATDRFAFPTVESPSQKDAGNIATMRLLAGQADANSAPLPALSDGRLPSGADEPARNWFLAGDRPGRVLVDFGKGIDLQAIRTYSWHPNSRADQVYEVYAPIADVADAWKTPEEVDRWASSQDFHKQSKRIVSVDSRDTTIPSSQVAVMVGAAQGQTLCQSRYLLLVIRPNDARRRFSQTFYSEIDFIDGNTYEATEVAQPGIDVLRIDDKYSLTFDTTETPDLTEWVRRDLMPACQQWYPRIVEHLASDDFEAPTAFSITFRDSMRGVAYTSGQDVVAAGPWYRNNLKGEAVGSILHELVHVVQQYPGRKNGPPSWLVEGIADHIRWYEFEPSERRRKINWDKAKYNDSYFASATFLDTIVQKIDPDAIAKVNAVCRQGRYKADYWMQQYDLTPDQIWELAKKRASEK